MGSGETQRRRPIEFTLADTPFLGVDDFRRQMNAEHEGRPSDEELVGTRIRIVQSGDAEQAQLIEISMVANLRVAPHAHEADEIFYVLEGELNFGRRVCGPGAAVAIPARTLYGFVVGASGVRFLNYSRSADSSYIPRARMTAHAG